MFLEISQNLQENTGTRVSFLIKFQRISVKKQHFAWDYKLCSVEIQAVAEYMLMSAKKNHSREINFEEMLFLLTTYMQVLQK